MPDISVPPFQKYFASKSDLRGERKQFYETFRTHFLAGTALDLDGQWSYGFVLMAELLKKKTMSLEDLRTMFRLMIDAYDGSPLSDFSNTWLADTYFLESKWQEGWDVLARDGVPLDVYMTLSEFVDDARITQQTARLWQPKSMTITGTLKDRREEVEATVIELLDAAHEQLGHSLIVELWDQLLAGRQAGEIGPNMESDFGGFLTKEELQEFLQLHDLGLYDEPRGAFKGSTAPTRSISWPGPYTNTYWFNQIARARLQSLFRDAENLVRRQNELPEVGQGWISEVTLMKSIKNAFPEHKVVHQGRPKWLGRQSLDVYFTSENIGIEYQGVQHSRPVSLFGGEEGFARTVERDNRKRELCIENECILIEVFPEYSLDDVLKQINEALAVQKEKGG